MNGTIKVKNETLVTQHPRVLCPFLGAPLTPLSAKSYRQLYLLVTPPSIIYDGRDREENGYWIDDISLPHLEVLKAGMELHAIFQGMSCGKAILRLRTPPPLLWALNGRILNPDWDCQCFLCVAMS